MNKFITKRKLIIYVGFLFCLCITLYNYVSYNLYISKDYNRNVYTVILINKSDTRIENAEIWYGDDNPNHYTLEKYETVCVDSGYLQKINIPTDNIIKPPPYNVYLKINGLEDTYMGYFGIETGGVGIAEISGENSKISCETLSESSKEYKKIYKWHRKNQNVMRR